MTSNEPGIISGWKVTGQGRSSGLISESPCVGEGPPYIYSVEWWIGISYSDILKILGIATKVKNSVV